MKFIASLILLLALSLQTLAATPTKEYEDVLTHLSAELLELQDPHHFDDLDIEIEKDDKKEEKKFKDLPLVNQKAFYVFQYQRMSNGMLFLKRAWNLEIGNIDKAGPNDATKDEIEGYLEELANLRKTTAAKFERYLDDNFTEEEVPKEELDKFKEMIHSWHDKEKLINRESNGTGTK